MLDIDFFKKVNDNYGYDAGDLVLRQLGSVLQTKYKGDQLVAIYGGEEFCFLLCSQNRDEALQVLESLRQ